MLVMYGEGLSRDCTGTFRMVGTTLLCADGIERASVGIRIKVLHLKSLLVVSAACRARVSRKRSE